MSWWRDASGLTHRGLIQYSRVAPTEPGIIVIRVLLFTKPRTQSRSESASWGALSRKHDPREIETEKMTHSNKHRVRVHRKAVGGGRGRNMWKRRIIEGELSGELSVIGGNKLGPEKGAVLS